VHYIIISLVLLLSASGLCHAGKLLGTSVGSDRSSHKSDVSEWRFPKPDITGIDWSAGKIRAQGKGMAPDGITGPERRQMARRAAIVDGQRNLLAMVQKIRISSDLDVKQYMMNNNHAVRIQGFIKGYSIVQEREVQDGSFEVILELPLTGPAGLSRYLND
jgi:hypothetical protein